MNEWLSIETAPRNERILLTDEKYILCGRFIDQAELDDWDNGDCLEPGWYEENLYHQDYDRYYMRFRATKWQPLPELPKGEKVGQMMYEEIEQKNKALSDVERLKEALERAIKTIDSLMDFHTPGSVYFSAKETRIYLYEILRGRVKG